MSNTVFRAASAALLALAAMALAGCQAVEAECEVINEEMQSVEPNVPENVTGLDVTVVKAGRDQAVGAGDIASMHYTGWLYDESAEDNRGKKFDSSRDRNQTFEFPLGEGRVIKGWDLGVAGMQIGEVRTLKIAPELGYGDRGAGGVIPGGATLLFEVELVSFKRCKVYD
ncbi:MAG: FKBP-type peptidyl-prolyl cis-trans isomerase [Pseudomonadota bacterium]